jgi:Tfp pilus assembly protein FimT
MKLLSSRVNKQNVFKASGFTLVEFVVIMGIFAIMVGVIMSNFNGFKSLITLDNLAQDIALSIRQVQTSAGSSLSTPDSPDQSLWRGIVFTPDATNGGYESNFILYETGNQNGDYTTDDVVIDTIKIQTTDKITGISYYGPNNLFADRQLLPSDMPVSIAFRRFSNNAKINPYQSQTVTCIELAAADAGDDNSKKRSVCVTHLGQISVH